MSVLDVRRRDILRATGLLTAAAALGVVPGPAWAQAFPTRPVRVVVPFPPGGALDVLARIVAQAMSEDLRQQVVVENRPGATGHVGSEAVARAAPDGYTLLFTASSTQVVSANLMQLNYKPMEDLVPVGLAALVNNVIVVHPSVPAQTMQELIAYAKANPDRIAYASTGVGSNLHLAAEMLNIMAGIRMRHIPYSTPQVIPDLLSGRVQLMVGNIPQVGPYVAEGKLRALAVTSLQRLPEYPNLPAVHELLPGYEVNAWGMLMAPKGLPPAVMDTLSSALRRSLETASVREAFAKQNFLAAPMSPQDSFNFMKTQSDQWARVIREANIPPISN